MSWKCYICLTEYNETDEPLLYCDKCIDGKICYQCVSQYPQESFYQCGICRQIMFTEEKNNNNLQTTPIVFSFYKIIFCCLPLSFSIFLNLYFYIANYKYLKKNTIIVQYIINCVLSTIIFYILNLSYCYSLYYMETLTVEYKQEFMKLRIYSCIMFSIFLFIFYNIIDSIFHSIVLIYEYISFELFFCLLYCIHLCKLRLRTRQNERIIRLINV